MTMQQSVADYYRDRAMREVAIAQAAGVRKAEASADYRKVFIERRDGSTVTVTIPPKR